jgi:hypothetical protein
MEAKLIAFGEIEIDGERYDHDVVIEAGNVSKRAKKASKPFRGEYGHTPLSVEEHVPWGGKQLIVGTGMYGSLPIMPQVHEEAKRRGTEIVVLPTEDACQLLRKLKRKDTYAILHITC